MAHTPNSPEDFWHGVNRTRGPEACWPWLRKPDATGRARYHFEGKLRDVHQIAYFIEYGVWLKRHDISQCQKLKTCCNPSHLKRQDIKHKALALDFARMTNQLDRQSAFSLYLSHKYPDLHWLIQLLGDNAGKFLQENEGRTVKLEMTIPLRSQLVEEARAVDCFSTLDQAEPKDRMKAHKQLQARYQCDEAAVEQFAKIGAVLLKDIEIGINK